jgi:hypothetical protein
MTTRKYSSRSQQTTLSGALTSSATTTTVVSGSALVGGVTISAGELFTVVIDPDTALEEIVDVSAISGNTLTIVRGIDGSTGVAHSAGAIVRHMAIGRDYREANTHIEATTGHGATGAVVGTTNTQTLTNKTLTSPTITGTGAIAGTFTGNLTGNVTGTVSGNAGTVTNGVYTTDTGTVTSTMIADGTIVNADINASAAIDKTKISGTAVTVADTGTVTSTMILDGTILNADINASAAIDKTKISGTAVTAGDTGTVTSTMIANDTIVNADINSAAAIAYSKLNLAGSITSSDIVDATIVNADISATAAIAKTKLDLGGTITSADLVDGTIVNSDINASAAIALSKLATDPLARANHTGTQTASTISDFDTQVRTSKVTDLAAPTGSFSMNSQKITSLATPTTGTDASTKDYVDAQITALVGGAPGTLDTLKEIADAISSGGSFESTVVLKSGSTMTGALTLSGAPTVDLHAATKAYVDTVAGSATAAAASATAAAASYDSFDDRYLGAKSSAPSVDNDGNTLGVGAIYWNSVTNQMFAWTGSAWGSISSTADIYRFRFTAAGGETSESGIDDNGLTLAYIPGKEQVYLNGVLLSRTSDYVATNGTSIASLAALTSGDILEVITFTAFELADSIARSLFDTKGDILVATSADTPGKITVGTDGQYLQADSSTATGLTWSTVSGYSAPTLGSTSIASGATVSNVAGLTINSTTIPTSKTLVDTDSSQTLTNKTLTGPVINLVTSAQTASYTLVLADSSDLVEISNASANNLTVPLNSSVAFPVGTQINILQTGAGQTTIVATGGVTINGTPGLKLRAQWSAATLIKRATDTWVAVGDLSA